MGMAGFLVSWDTVAPVAAADKPLPLGTFARAQLLHLGIIDVS
jgi:hypothetical protein